MTEPEREGYWPPCEREGRRGRPTKTPLAFRRESLSSPTSSNSLTDLWQRKGRTLGQLVAHLMEQIDERRAASGTVAAEIERQFCETRTQLLALESWPLGDPTVEGRRQGLERRLDLLSQEKRQERLQCWRDIASVSRELRDWLKQHAELAQQLKLIDSVPRYDDAGNQNLYKTEHDT